MFPGSVILVVLGCVALAGAACGGGGSAALAGGIYLASSSSYAVLIRFTVTQGKLAGTLDHAYPSSNGMHVTAVTGAVLGEVSRSAITIDDQNNVLDTGGTITGTVDASGFGGGGEVERALLGSCAGTAQHSGAPTGRPFPSQRWPGRDPDRGGPPQMETAMPRFSPEDVERFIEALRADDALRARVEQAILSDRLVRLPEAVDAGLHRLEGALDTLVGSVNRLAENVETLAGNVNTLVGSVATLTEAVDSRLATLEHAVAETNRNMNWLVQDGFPRMLGIVSKIGSDVEQVKGDVMAVKVDVAQLNDRMSVVERHLGLAS